LDAVEGQPPLLPLDLHVGWEGGTDLPVSTHNILK
jgi:hypothetical protein